jgi:hypothetical protein
MYEIRIYRTFGTRYSSIKKVRIAKIKKTGSWFGFFAWVRFWFTLRKTKHDKIEGIGILPHPNDLSI